MIVLPSYLLFIFAVVGSFGISLFSIPNIIYIAKRKRLFDRPDNHRKLHTRIVPNLGGIGIFFAFFITVSLFIKSDFTTWNYIASACLILFITGLKDDLVSISSSKKFIAQAAAATITVVFAGVRLHSLGGLFWAHELPVWISIPFSIIGCMFVTNAFNLIDGIDGLAGTVGVYIAGMLGLFLAAYGDVSAAILAFSLCGAIIGFLKSNLPPAKIFMGDTGSLLIGFVIAILSILTINAYHSGGIIGNLIISAHGIVIVTLAVIFLPVFDTFRVFSMRILRGHSPFRADRTHLHHYLLDIGLSHGQTVTALLFANIFVTCLALFVQRFNINLAVGCLILVMLALYACVVTLRRRQMKIGNTKIRFGLKNVTRRKPMRLGRDGVRIPNTVLVNGKAIHLEEQEMAGQN